MSYYTLITDIGRAKEANAKATGTALVLTHFAVGDGGGAVYNPAADQMALVNETHRVPINAIYVDDDNPTWLVVEAVLLATVGGWYVREAAVIDADGDLYAIIKYPETYKPVLDEGVGKDLHLRVICETANTADITLKIDPAVVLATRDYADYAAATAVTAHEAEDNPHPQYATDAELSAHVGSRDHPAATTAAQGLVELATNAEAAALADAVRALTPAALGSMFGSFLSGTGGYQKLPGGLIIQWGVNSANTDSNLQTYSFPIAFPTFAMWGLAADCGDNGPFVQRFDILSNSTFTIVTTNSGADKASWLAIGY